MRIWPLHLGLLMGIGGISVLLSTTPTLGMPEATSNGATPPTPHTRLPRTFYEHGLLPLLKARDFVTLESATRLIQEQFSTGALSDIELRNIYRQFYDLDATDLSNTEAWKKAVPKSYAAHLVRGVFFKRYGFEVRGERVIGETPPENLRRMRYCHALALAELTDSVPLTPKPFLSVFHLLDISKSSGDKDYAKKLLLAANRMLPQNTLARNRFMLTLTPRWGGSYEEMRDFLLQSKQEGVNTLGLLQLEAIMFDDMADMALVAGDRQSASHYYDQASARAQRIGGGFRQDWLEFLNTPCAHLLAAQKYC